MNKKILIMVLLCVFLSLVLICCGVNTKTIQRMQKLEEGVSNPTTIEELEVAIEKYQSRVEDIILAQQQIGIWYKMLGSRYIDEQMYGKALGAFQMASEYYPANPNLFYWIGVSAGFMAKQSLDFTATGSTAQKYNYLKLSEEAYLRAIELDPKYARALYGLGVLYVFDLDEPAKAIPYLETLLDIETKNVDGMFVLARAYYTTYEFEKAVDMYDRIIKTTTSAEKKAQAEANKRQVLETAYEG